MKKFVRGLAILLAAIFAATGVPAAQIFAAEEEPLVRTEAQDLLKEDSGAASVNRLLETKWTENDFASSSEDLSAMGGSGEAANGQDGEASVAGVSDEGNSDGADTVSDQSVSDDKEEPTADNDKNLSNDGNNNDEDLSEERISGNDEDLSPDEDADGSNKNSDEDSEKGKGSDEEKVNDKNKLNPEGEQSKTADPEDAQSKAADTKGEQSKTADTEKSEDNDNLLSQKEETVSDGTNAVPEEQTENTVPTQEPEVPLTDKQPPVLASAGRAVLALPAGFLLAAALDNTTTLDDGEYTEFEFGWAGGTGKARLTLEKIVVKNGKATGVFTASSANMTHVYYLGHTSTDADDPTYYNPSTGACGTGVLPISNQSVEFPVALNEQTNIACRTVAMSAPHWVNYNYTITIEEPEPKPDLADYTAVDQALAKAEKIDRSIYTADSLAVLDKAVKAVVRDLPESKQKKVDAMAKAIEDAIAGLVLDIDDEKIDLKVTNNTGFLNVDSAYVQKEEEDIYLYLILTDGAFRNLFKGTFEQAVKNGDKTGRWISGTQDKDKKWEFKIPVAAGESFMNFAAIQQAAYKNYLAGKTPIERAFYPGQLTLNLKNETLNLSEYFSSLNLTVNNRATKVLPKSAVLTTQKGPNSPDYSCMLSLTMEDKAFDQLFIGTAKQAEKASAQNIYNLNKKTFEVPARWMASAGKPETMETIIGSPVTLSFHSAEYGIWYERVVTIDEQKAEILFKNEQKTADYHAVNLAVQEAEAVNRELYTAKSLKALDKAVAGVIKNLPESGQKLVDAMAEEIEKALKGLELDVKDGRTYLTITNTTGMFKAETAYVLKKGNKLSLFMTLSGEGYHDLFKGTYEQAVANGDNPKNWIHGQQDSAGKWEFEIPLKSGETYIPCVAISNTYYQSYKEGKNVLARSFFPRQLVIDVKKKTLVTGDYEFTQELKITNNVTMFKPEKASLETLGGPNSNNYSSNLVLQMGSDAFDKAYLGDKTAAAKAAPEMIFNVNGRTFTIPVRWTTEFGNPESLVSLVGKKAVLSFHSLRLDQWYERAFTINEEKGTIVFDPVEEGKPVDPVIPPTPGPDPGKEDDPSKPEYNDTTGGGTAAVDNSTGLADGIYTPDKFSFSGGTGKIVISCNQVEVRDGKAYATIVFSNVRSGSTEMTYVKASGGTYYCTQSGGTSVVTIPIELNKNNSILAMTTKMSAAHEIAYTIFVYINGGDSKGGSDLAKSDSLDEEAPEIAGLEYQSEEEVDHAEYFKVYNYSDGIRLLEIDMRTKEEKKESEKEGTTDETQQNEEETTASDKENSDEVIIDEETGAEVKVSASRADSQAELYKGKVVKYLIVPKDVEIPAGLDKETIVIQLPVGSIYSGAEEIRKAIETLNQKKLITCQPEEDKDNEEIAAAGNYDKLKVKTLVKKKVDLAILPSEILKDKKEKEIFKDLGEDMANLDIALIVDRSKEEETDEAKAEWLKVYGILLGCEEAAEQAYQEAITK